MSETVFIRVTSESSNIVWVKFKTVQRRWIDCTIKIYKIELLNYFCMILDYPHTQLKRMLLTWSVTYMYKFKDKKLISLPFFKTWIKVIIYIYKNVTKNTFYVWILVNNMCTYFWRKYHSNLKKYSLFGRPIRHNI